MGAGLLHGAPRARFQHHETPRPSALSRLDPSHPALIAGRTIFPSTVVAAERAPRLLVSGHNQRKLGDRVSKGAWRGFAIYALTLEERATCPGSCHHWSDCFGNAMPFSRRHQHGAALESRLGAELAALQRKHRKGFAVRTHILGDYYSAAYVARWRAWLGQFPALHVFGFTAWGRETEIGAAVAALTEEQWGRFAIRFSQREPGPQTAVPAPTEGAIICPAQVGRTAHCGSCGLCWAAAARGKSIAFLTHGMTRGKGPREPKPMATPEPPTPHDPGKKPELGWLPVAKLSVDERYQRNIESARSRKLIDSIELRFNWSAFQAIVVTDAPDGGWAVIDGQHRIAAAKRLGYLHVPAVIVKALSVAEQAAIFVQANQDRVSVNSITLHHARVTANDRRGVVVAKILKDAGLAVPRTMVVAKALKPGEVTAVAAIEWIVKNFDERVAALAVQAVADVYRNSPSYMRAPLFKACANMLVDAENADKEMVRLAEAMRQWDGPALYREAERQRGATGKGAEVVLELILSAPPTAKTEAKYSDPMQGRANGHTQPVATPAKSAPGPIKQNAFSLTAKRPALSAAETGRVRAGLSDTDDGERFPTAITRRCQGCGATFQTKRVSEYDCPSCSGRQAAR